jgi:hypothetical protein
MGYDEEILKNPDEAAHAIASLQEKVHELEAEIKRLWREVRKGER